MVVFAFLPFLNLADPAPSLTRSRARARDLVCVRVDSTRGSIDRPGRIRPTAPRGDDGTRTTLVCSQRVLRRGLRDPGDEAILAHLEERASDVALRVSSLDPALRGRTWLVEAFTGDARVADKLSFATQNALMAQGLAVSDRVPAVGPGDVEVLTRLPPRQAYPAACERYAATGSLREGDALVAVVRLDRRATSLEAGLCVDGAWRWLP